MRSDSTRVHEPHTRTTAPALHLPLRRLALCLDCEMCYEIGAPACTACGGDTFVPLANFLEEAPRRVLSNKTAKQLIVVARDQQRLFEYARRAFAGNPTVEVVLDRRRGERRGEDQLRTPERRRGDRRVTLEVDDRLRTTGWAIVRLDVFRSFGAASRS